MTVQVVCPSCNAEMPLDVILTHKESRAALARLIEISVPHGKLVLRYLTLFQVGERRLQQRRVVSLLEDLLPDMERGAIERHGRHWAAPLPIWRSALERVLEVADKGQLALPLTSHGYLYQVIAATADKAEAKDERAIEEQRRSRAYEAGAEPIGELLTPAAPAGPAPTPSPPAAAPAGPSRMARQMRAQAEAALAARKGGTPENTSGEHA